MGNEASLQHEGRRYGTTRVNGVSGRRTLDGVTLVFSCELRVQPSEGWLIVNDVAGHVDVDGADLGPAWSLNSFRARSSSQEEATSYFVCVAAKDADIRAIERLRTRKPNTDAVTFTLWLRLRGAASTGPLDSQAVLTCTVTTSDWFAALAAAQYESRYVIDVPVQGGRVSSALATAAEHYRHAIEQLKKASYTPVFVECRKVLESTRDVLNLNPKNIAELDARQKRNWSIRECIEYTRASIHQILHHAAHPGTHDEPGQHEAELVLALSGAMLRYYAGVQ
jgi:hypothetical protein